MGFKVWLFSTSVSFVMLSGGMVVLSFVFIELWDDKCGSSFLLLLGIFVSFMLIVILSNDLVFLYLGWEGIGVTSLFLVYFWNERYEVIKLFLKFL